MSDYVRIYDAAKLIGRTMRFVRTLVRTGRVVGDPERPGYVSVSSLLAYMDDEAERSAYVDRPSARACRMIRRKIRADQGINEELRALFLDRVDAYEREWEEAANARKEKKE